MKLIFLGPPAAGKGTISQLVCKEFGIAHISTGDMLREEISNGTELGKQAKSFMDAGQLVPDSVIIGMVKVRLSAPDCEKGFVFDGFPRTLEQAQALDEIIHIDAVVNFEADDEMLVQRIAGRRVCEACGHVHHVSWLKDGQNTCDVCAGRLIIRPDDNEETMRKRLDVYHKQTAPLIEYYQSQGNLHNVNASGSVDGRFAEIVSIIEKL